MLSIQINTMAMLLSEFDFLPVYRADLAGSRTLSFRKDLESQGKVREFENKLLWQAVFRKFVQEDKECTLS